MAYDFDVALDREAPAHEAPRSQPKDLESIVMLLELAAIALASTPESEFTRDQLIAEARKIGGSDATLDENDADIVLEKAEFLKKQSKHRFRLK